MKSGQTLFLDEGAVVYASVHALDAENIKILGRGILDNGHNHEVVEFEENVSGNSKMVKNAKRQHTIQPEYCTGIEINGITIRNSLVYNVRMIACEDIHISNVKIIGSWKYNSDGINSHNTKNLLIENCFIRTFDDSVCVKGFDFYTVDDVDKAVYEASHHKGKVYETAEHVRVRNCTIWSDYSQSFSIGAETKAEEIFDVVFEDSDIIHFNCAAMDCHNIDYADVHHITYQNLNVEYDDTILCPARQKSDDHVYENPDPDWTPYLFAVKTTYHPEYSFGGTRRGKSHDLLFKNIRMFGKHRPKIVMLGYDEEHKTKDVTFENLYWNGVPVTNWDEFILEWDDEFTENIRLIVTE